MSGKVSILNFDYVYEVQSFYRHIDYRWLDFSVMKNINGYCTPRSLAVIRRRLRERSHKGITFIGGGNYHYVSLLLLEEINEPFTLVLFDYHTDIRSGIFDSSLLSCGSWVLEALTKLPLLKHVVMIGVKGEEEANLPESHGARVSLFSIDKIKAVKEGGFTDLLSLIPTEAVYISIDKDVLAREDAITDWEQGELQLEQLLSLINRIGSGKKIRGLDVCGEYSALAADSFCREYQMAAALNDRANDKILSMALKLISDN